MVKVLFNTKKLRTSIFEVEAFFVLVLVQISFSLQTVSLNPLNLLPHPSHPQIQLILSLNHNTTRTAKTSHQIPTKTPVNIMLFPSVSSSFS